jgi:hypothetical protein
LIFQATDQDTVDGLHGDAQIFSSAIKEFHLGISGGAPPARLVGTAGSDQAAALRFLVGDAAHGTGGDRLINAFLITSFGSNHIRLALSVIKGENIRAQFNAGSTADTYILINDYLFHYFTSLRIWWLKSDDNCCAAPWARCKIN